MKFSSKMVRYYQDAVLFNETDEAGNSLGDNYDCSDFDSTALVKIENDIRKFLNSPLVDKAVMYIEATQSSMLNQYDCTAIEHILHDLHFTRAGSGVGFWETPDYPKGLGKALCDLTLEIGDIYFYVGEDNLIYCM